MQSTPNKKNQTTQKNPPNPNPQFEISRFMVWVILVGIGLAIALRRQGLVDFIWNNWAVILDSACKLSSIFLVVGLFLAYRQYRETAVQTRTQVELAKTSAKREALCLAAQQCDHYGGHIMKLSGDLIKRLREKTEFYKRGKVIIKDDEVTFDITDMRPEDHKKILEFFPDIVLVLNTIEGFSIYFASNVADDNIGYIECGRGFVKQFEDNFGLYCVDNRIQNYYKATQALYWRWKKRLVNEELVKHHQELAKQMSITSQKIDPSKLKPNNPVGV